MKSICHLSHATCSFCCLPNYASAICYTHVVSSCIKGSGSLKTFYIDTLEHAHNEETASHYIGGQQDGQRYCAEIREISVECNTRKEV